MGTDELTPKMEDYLEAIYVLERERGEARIGEIAEWMGVTPASANAAVKSLQKRGLARFEPYARAQTTKKGERLGARVKSMHDTLLRFMSEFLLLDHELIEREACLIEHSISPATFERLSKFLDFMDSELSEGGPRARDLFEFYLETGRAPDLVSDFSLARGAEDQNDG